MRLRLLLLPLAIAACGHQPTPSRSLLQSPDDLLIEAPDSGQIDVIGLTEPGADGKRDGHLVLTVGMPTGNTIRGIDLYGEGYYDSFGHNKWFSADVQFEDGTVRTIDLKR